MPINAILQGQSYTRPQVDAALALKQNVLTFDDTPTANSNNPVKSGGIKTELDGKLPIAENQENAPVGYILTKTSTGSQWQRASSEGGTIAAAANSYPVTLLAANWSDYTYVIATPTGATITADCDGILGLAPNASAAQVEAFQLAKIVVASQDANGVTVVARGQVPTINLNLELTLFMKADYYTKTEEDALLATKAPLGSPALTGTPTAPTAAAGTNTTQIATTAFVESELSEYGLNNSGGIELDSNDDLDNITDTGWYYWTGTPINAPKTNIGNGAMCVDRNGVNIRQTVYRGGTPNVPELYIRYKNSTNAWSKWFTQSLESAAGAISLHVAPTGNDANDGLTSATPLLTINAAIAKISNNYLGYGASILLADGSYAAFTLQGYNATTITISKESSATGTNVIVAGGTIQYNSNTFVFINNITITGALALFGQQGPASYLLTNVLFDGGYINGRGPWCRINNCTFRNKSTGEAIYFAEGFAMCEGLTIESTVAKGVVAASAAVITVSTGSLTNNAAIPYGVAQSGRIFVGTMEYGGPPVWNPNMLDNWYFVGGGSQRGGSQFPINQRGQTSYNSSNMAYCIDRWKTYASQGGTAVLNSGYITLTATGNTSCNLFQYVDMAANELAGKTITVSMLDSNGLSYGTLSNVTVPSNRERVINVTVGNYGGIEVYLSAGGHPEVFFAAKGHQTINIIAVKFELGDTQTLAHQENGVWVLNEIPNYGEQFERCITSKADSTDTYANKSLVTMPIKTLGSGTLTGYAESFADGGTVEQVTYSNISDAPENGIYGICQIFHFSATQKLLVAYSRSGKIYKKLRSANATWASSWTEIT